jgi:hypothetical protein
VELDDECVVEVNFRYYPEISATVALFKTY